ncbi:MAG: sugar ABC transporter permease [Defluviitaleaceae bacterium]|nr:sugar ABC transporter permease [Defluviitaleaceae bacterium]MCL2836243.1 sugar ABC transporter permease [Defluviitaleaceae bacterium]
MERVMRDKKAAAIFILPAFMLFTLIIIVPVVMSIYYSTLDWNGIGRQTFIGFSNYIELLTDRDRFLPAVYHTFIIAAASVFIQLPLALLLALILASKVKGERFFITVYFIPVILSAVVIGQLWMRIYFPRGGLLNTLLINLGFMDPTRPTAWLGDVNTALGAVLVPILWQYVGYHMLLYYSGIKSLPPEIYEAARIDGAGFWQTAFKITIPLLKPVLQVSLTFCVVGSMKVFDLVRVMLTDGGPSGSGEVITTLMVRRMFYPSNRYGYGSAMAIILILMCVILYQFVAHIFRDRDKNRKGKVRYE